MPGIYNTVFKSNINYIQPQCQPPPPNENFWVRACSVCIHVYRNIIFFSRLFGISHEMFTFTVSKLLYMKAIIFSSRVALNCKLIPVSFTAFILHEKKFNLSCFQLSGHRTRSRISDAATRSRFRTAAQQMSCGSLKSRPCYLSTYFKFFPFLVIDTMNGVVCGETGGCRRKSNDDESRIPVLSPGLFQRTASLRLRGERSSYPSFPQPITEGAQSCTKVWPRKPPSQHRSQVSVLPSSFGSASHNTSPRHAVYRQ